MADRFEMDNAGMENLLRSVDSMFETKLGPMMKAEVVRNTPVDTGKLRDSVYYEVDRSEHELNVGATGDPEREEGRQWYALFVDLGHRIFVYGHDTGRVRQPTAFIRKALYRRYGGF